MFQVSSHAIPAGTAKSRSGGDSNSYINVNGKLNDFQIHNALPRLPEHEIQESETFRI